MSIQIEVFYQIIMFERWRRVGVSCPKSKEHIATRWARRRDARQAIQERARAGTYNGV